MLNTLTITTEAATYTDIVEFRGLTDDQVQEMKDATRAMATVGDTVTFQVRGEY